MIFCRKKKNSRRSCKIITKIDCLLKGNNFLVNVFCPYALIPRKFAYSLLTMINLVFFWKYNETRFTKSGSFPTLLN